MTWTNTGIAALQGLLTQADSYNDNDCYEWILDYIDHAIAVKMEDGGVYFKYMLEDQDFDDVEWEVLENFSHLKKVIWR